MSARFYIIDRADNGTLAEVPRVKLCKVIKTEVGDVNKVKLLKSGQVLVEVKNDAQGKKLSNLKTIGTDVKVTVKQHAHLNTSKGVITSRDLQSSELVEILDELKTQGVIEVRNIMTKRNGILSKSNSFILTFQGINLPETVKLCFEVFKVRPYVPKPRRCFKCFSFKHLSNVCNKRDRCFRCGLDKHDGNCLAPVKCVNCNGQHFSTAMSCPHYIEQYKIKEIQSIQNISYYRAQQIINQSLNRATYASVTREGAQPKTYSTMSTQTCRQDWHIETAASQHPLEPKITILNYPTTPLTPRHPTNQNDNALNVSKVVTNNELEKNPSEIKIDPKTSGNNIIELTEPPNIIGSGGQEKRKSRAKKKTK